MNNAYTSIIVGIIFVATFLFSIPLFSIFIILIFLSSHRHLIQRQHFRYGLYILLAFSISFINLSKPISGSDLGYYYWLYNYAGEKSFFQFLSIIPKEPLYHIYSYVMHWLTLGNFKLFLVINTMIIYVLIMVSYDKLCKYLRVASQYAIFASILLLLFSEFFFYTAQIIRQVLAGAVALYGLTRLFCEGKKYSLIIVGLSGLIHASAFIFLLALPLYFLRNRNFALQCVLTLICVVGYTFILKLLNFIFTDDSTLNMAIERGLSSNIEQIKIGILPLAVCGAIVPMSFYLIKRNTASWFRSFVLIPISLVCFVIININKPLFVLRFMEYIYMFIPIIVILMIYLYFSKPQRISILLIVLCLFRFVLKISASDFQFMQFSDFLSSGIVQYLIVIFGNEYCLC